MKNSDLISHVKGESLFIDDFSIPEETLYLKVFTSNIAHAKIKHLDIQKAEKIDGVFGIFTSKDIPGINQVGGIIQDETLLAEDEVKFIGEPIAIVAAKSKKIANEAIGKIRIDYQPLEIITDPVDAFNKNQLIMPPKIFESGSIEKAWKDCDLIVEDTVESGGQEHIYLETQGAIAFPLESGKIKIISSTQSPTAVQRAVARVLNYPMNKIEVDVLRLGGGFGGKEDQATHWAVLCSLAAYKLNKPVKLVLSRIEDMLMTGKRHPYFSHFKLGLKKSGKLIAYEVTFYQNAGACADLSPAILERTLFHATNSYYIPNVKATGISCKTNLPPFTAFRGFGGPQGKFVIEAAIYKAADILNISPLEIQKKNLIKTNQKFYYGQKLKNAKAIECWNYAEDKYHLNSIQKEIINFNAKNKLIKKGFAVMPICFGISFTSSFLNQASSLIHIYTDGSVGVSTAAVEMGQGVNEKIKIAVAKTFSINLDRIKIESTNTTRIANTSPTAASTGADLNCNAAVKASKNILKRLLEFASVKLYTNIKNISLKNEFIYVNNRKSQINWNELVKEAYYNRINLSSHEYYSTPKIYFDRTINQGSPFAYHVFGTAGIEITLDCLRGTYKIDKVNIVHDFGKSLNQNIDLGQLEGALVQGIGWMTLEELRFNSDGKLLSNSFSTYKVPDIYTAPDEINVQFLTNSTNKFTPFNSKAIGEPPLMYGIAVYFAIANAIKSFNSKAKIKYSAPFTPEKVLLTLYNH